MTIQIRATTPEEAATLADWHENGVVPDVFYEHGFMIQVERDGVWRTVRGGGKSVTVHYTGPLGDAPLGRGGGSGGTGETNIDPLDVTPH